MNTLLIYMVKAAFYMAAFYMVYSLLLSRDTMYARNRIFILASIGLAFLLPSITIYTSKPVNLPFFGKSFSEVLITATGSGKVVSQHPIGLAEIVAGIYVAGMILFGIRLLFDLAEIIYLIMSTGERKNKVIRFSGLNTSGFSAMGHIFINKRLTDAETDEIIRHEQNHLDHNHFSDLIFLELVRIIQWFNPFVHMFNKSLRAVHEYQADEECITSGIPVTSYQNLLMTQVFRSKAFSITNSFSNPTLIKKRMIMMTKKRSGMLANLKLLMVLPVAAIMLVAFSSCKGKKTPTYSEEKVVQGMPIPPDAPPPPPVPDDVSKQKVMLGDEVKPGTPPPPPPPPGMVVQNGDSAWFTVDNQPVFPGGDNALSKFIVDNTKYPPVAKEKGIQGRVIVRFVVSTTGEVRSPSVVRGVNSDLDAEAVRVVSLLPKFEKPGYQKGKPVPVWFMLPITFALQ